ncbi:hypothetical protein QBC38DRAFT_350675, partial [Podospora fimiseda]
EGDISETMGNMAKSMTDYLRSRSEVSAPGVTLDPVLHIQVRWEWLTPPLLVQLMATVFFVLVVYRSSETEGLELWKDSSVALLAHDVVEDEYVIKQASITPPEETVRQLHQWAEGLKTRI